MRLLASAILALCVQSVCAQSILKDPKELSVLLNEVVVTGTGTEHYLKDAPVQTEVITGKALDSYQGRSMQDILEGLNASITFNPSDMGSGIQMNGLGNDYILILINGKRINGDTGGQNDLSIINPANIERIEIVKGAASSLYGSDAIAGVINIITKKNRDKVSLSNTTRVGSYGDILESVQIGFGHKRVNSTTSLSTTHTDGWRNTTQEWDHHEVMDGTVTRTVNRSTNFTLRENLTYKVNDRLSLSADGSFYQKWNYRPHGAFKYYTYDQFYRNFDVAGGAKYTLGGLNFLSVDLTYGNYSYFYNYHHKDVTNFFDPETGLRITRYPGGTYSGNLSTTFPRTSQKRIPPRGKQYPKRRTRISIRSFEISPAYRERESLRIYGFRLCTRRMEPDRSVECDGRWALRRAPRVRGYVYP